MQTYFQEVQGLIQEVSEKEMPVIKEVASIIANHIRQNGILQFFGCGHSHLLAQEAFYRAGGLVPVRSISIEPLMLHRGALTSSKNEKDPNFVADHITDFDFQTVDVLIIISTSGRNVVPIDVALLAKQAGVFTISLQSLNYSNQPSRHATKKRLEEIVDVVINTHVPIGDGVLNHEGIQYGPVSTTIGATILNALISQVIEDLSHDNNALPVFGSCNVENASRNNESLIEQYKHRINFN
ncbi:sugar isomerase domain-containing protein [Rummeliibacillus pycnus]|uniref:sugar isomerase domain-containing protein n=1 Tax=Rummeliibacillus pycnus TaxID=101070 RepID=UPI003D2A6368